MDRNDEKQTVDTSHSVECKNTLILLGNLAHRRMTNTFKDLPPKYKGMVGSARLVYPEGGNLGLPSAPHRSLGDVVQRIPKIRHRIPWAKKQYLFGLDKTMAQADVIISHGAVAQYSSQAVKYCERTGCPLIIHEVESIPYVNYGSELHEQRVAALLAAKLVIAVTNRARTAMIVEGIPDSKIRQVPFGIDTELFNPEVSAQGMRARFGFSEDDTVVLYVGRISWAKGVYDLLYAAKLLAGDPSMSKCKLRFALAGGGPDIQSLKGLIERLNLSDTFKLIGGVSYADMPSLYASSDMVIIPSKPDGRTVLDQCPLVMHESMAMGKPLIGSYCGGIPEVIGDTGLLVNPGDPLTISEAIKQLALNPGMRQEIGEAGLAKARSLFDSKIVGAQCADVLDEALA